jgi:hypothetical protein
VLGDVLAHGLEQVRLAEAGAAVDEERVVRLRGRLRDRERRRVREPVRRADHERVERVLRVQALVGRARRRRRCRLWPIGGLRGRLLTLALLANLQSDRPLVTRELANRGLDEPEEVSLDPLAREVVRDGQDDRLVGHLTTAHLVEPGAVGGVVERLLQPVGDLVPEVIGGQLSRALHSAAPTPLARRKERRA